MYNNVCMPLNITPNSPTFHYSLICPCLESQLEQATYKASYKVWFTNKKTVLLVNLLLSS